MKVCCDTEGRELTDERRYAPTSVPLRRKPCSRSPETLFHFTGIPSHHQLVLRVHRRLRVVALLEPLTARLHDRALRVREVALRLLVRLAIRPLVRPTALRVPVLTLLPTPRGVRRPSRRFQTRLRFPDRRQTRFSPTQLRRQIVAPNLRAQARVLGLVNRIRLTQQRLDLAFQALFLCLHPVVAHRLALTRVRAHLRPVNRQLPQARQTQLLRQTDHLHEQRLEILQVPTPELAQRPVLRKVARRQHPERNVLFQLPSHPARREHPRRVGVEQHLHHHPRLIRRVATAVPLVQSVERPQIQTVHQIADMVRQVALRQPLPNVGRQQQRLVRHVGAECGRHRVLPFVGSPTIVASVFLRRRLLLASSTMRAPLRIRGHLHRAGCGPATAAMFLTTVQRATRDSGTGPPTGPFAKLPKASAASSSDARGLRGQDRRLTAEERANVLATCLHPRRTGRGHPARRYD